jgi:hypothetical protein
MSPSHRYANAMFDNFRWKNKNPDIYEKRCFIFTMGAKRGAILTPVSYRRQHPRALSLAQHLLYSSRSICSDDPL